MSIHATMSNSFNIGRIAKHIVFLGILFFLLPGFYFFEICIVLPSIVEQLSFKYLMHVICATFLLLNIIGNMIFGMFTDTSIKRQFLNGHDSSNWTFCAVCESVRPPRAWHCDTCNTCILKRDHHCSFFACCIGYYNHRYFMLFTLDIFVSMMYAFYYNVYFLANFIKWNNGFVIIKFLFPLASFVADLGYESLYIFMVVVNVIVGLLSGFLFLYHLKNILNGQTAPETKYSSKEFIYNRGWKQNIIEVFGVRWYYTWLLPYINSPLPGNGIDWMIEDKSK